MLKVSILITMLSLLACVGCRSPVSDPEHILEYGEAREEVQALFAQELENGQYCFYEKSFVISDLLDQNVIADHAFGTEKETAPDFKIDNDKKEETVSKLINLAAGSSLLTPRSIDKKDLLYVLASDSRWFNFRGNVGIHFWGPAIPVCVISSTALWTGIAMQWLFAKLLPVPVMEVVLGFSIVSCSFVFAVHALSTAFSYKGLREARDEISKLDSTSSLHLVSRTHMQKITSIFTWLESQDAATCPVNIEFSKLQEREEAP